MSIFELRHLNYMLILSKAMESTIELIGAEPATLTDSGPDRQVALKEDPWDGSE